MKKPKIATNIPLGVKAQFDAVWLVDYHVGHQTEIPMEPSQARELAKKLNFCADLVEFARDPAPDAK